MSIEDIASQLALIGLSGKESLVYAALIEKGGAYPSAIAEATTLNRSTVYKILLELSVKGLVTEITKKNKLFYQVEDPRQLMRYLRGRVNTASTNLEHAEKLMPVFEGWYAAYTNKPRVTYFEGPAGIMAIYDDMVSGKRGYEMRAFSNASSFESVLPQKAFGEFLRKKVGLGITTRGIIPDTHADRTYVERNFRNVPKAIRPDVRIVPQELFPYKGEITLYAQNKVAITNLNRDFLTGVIIQDPTIYGMFGMVFELAWRSAVTPE